jgi:hypothetical protein
MKRTQLIEYGIIAIGIIFCYRLLESAVTLLIQIVYMFLDSNFGSSEIRILPYLLLLAVYAVCFVSLIKNSKKIATHFLEPGEENIKIKIGKKALLQIVLIAISVAAVIYNAADVILYLFNAFKRSVNGRARLDTMRFQSDWEHFITSALTITIGVIVIYFSQKISNWILKDDKTDELVFESEETEEKN